jgi:hypothetical protein
MLEVHKNDNCQFICYLLLLNTQTLKIFPYTRVTYYSTKRNVNKSFISIEAELPYDTGLLSLPTRPATVITLLNKKQIPSLAVLWCSDIPVLLLRNWRHIFYRSLLIPDNPCGICGGQIGITDISSAGASAFPPFVMIQSLHTRPSTTDVIYF